MRRIEHLSLPCLLGLCFVFQTAWAGTPGGAVISDRDERTISDETRRGFIPGSNSTYPWINIEPKRCKEAQKPVILYIYDDALRGFNHTAWFFENNVFPDPRVQRVLKDFTFVRSARSAAAWSNFCLTKADEGAAVFLMTYDGTVHNYWMKDRRCMVEEFAAEVVKVAKTNPYVLERAKVDVVLEVDWQKLRQAGPRPEDPLARKEAVIKLSVQLAAMLKDGEQPKVWVEVLGGKRQELPVAASDAKTVTVLLASNRMALPWEKMSPEALLSVAKSVTGERNDRLLLAAEVALAVGYVDQAVELLSKTRLETADLKAQAYALATRITPALAQPQAAPAEKAASIEKAAEAMLESVKAAATPAPGAPAVEKMADPPPPPIGVPMPLP